MKVLPVFKASTIAVFSSSTSWSSWRIPLLPSLVRKNLWTEEGDSLPRVFRRRFQRRSADPLFSAVFLLSALDSFAGLTWGTQSHLAAEVALEAGYRLAGRMQPWMR